MVNAVIKSKIFIIMALKLQYVTFFVIEEVPAEKKISAVWSAWAKDFQASSEIGHHAANI